MFNPFSSTCLSLGLVIFSSEIKMFSEESPRSLWEVVLRGSRTWPVQLDRQALKYNIMSQVPSSASQVTTAGEYLFQKTHMPVKLKVYTYRRVLNTSNHIPVLCSHQPTPPPHLSSTKKKKTVLKLEQVLILRRHKRLRKSSFHSIKRERVGCISKKTASHVFTIQAQITAIKNTLLTEITSQIHGQGPT